MRSLPGSEIADAAQRLTALIDERDAVEIEEIVTRVESDQTLRDWYANDPRHVLSMLIEQVLVKSGQVPIAQRVDVHWNEYEDYDD